MAEEARRYGRYVDALASPLFPFGFGLSYRQCALSSVRVEAHGARSAVPMVVSVEVASSEAQQQQAAEAEVGRGEARPAACTEVVQCYLRDEPVSRHARRARRLVGFARVELPVGERRRVVRLDVTAESLARLDDDGKSWRVAPGAYGVACGADSEAAEVVTVQLAS